MKRATEVRVPEDYGFFGPDSIAWRVSTYPTSLTIAFQRTVVTEMFEPFVLAAVADTGAVANRPAVRYDRTMQYMATVTFGDSRSVLRASEVLMRIHTKAVGIEPISGLPYDGNDPDGQLWIHLTAWHSLLYCYEKFGPGRLSPAEEERYWAECARAAEFHTIDLDKVPRSREEMHAYYERMRPRLAATEATQQHVETLLNGAEVLLPDHLLLRPVRAVARAVFRRGTIATLPGWMRTMAGVRQSRLTDAAVTALLRVGFFGANQNLALKRAMVRMFSPHTAPVVDPVLLKVVPTNPVTYSPAQARELHGAEDPRVQYARILAEREQASQAPVPTKDGTEPLLAFG